LILENNTEKNRTFYNAREYVWLEKKQKSPVRNGIIWSQPVAQFILEMYPDILESDMEMVDILRIINGNY